MTYKENHTEHAPNLRNRTGKIGLLRADLATTPPQLDGAVQPERVDQSADGRPKNKLSVLLHVGLGVMLLLGLFTLSRYNFLLFHGIAELFSIAVAWSTFFLVWNIRREMRNDALLFLGMAYFFVGSLDLVHTLVYKGTGFVALDLAANYATQLWIAARSLEAVCLFLFPFLLTRRIQLWPVVFCLTSVTGLIFATIFAWHLFPACYIEGTGLTPFKKTTEYAICLTLTAAMVFIVRRRKHLDAEVFQLMMWAMALTIAGELAFTFYVSVYGVSNVAGHFFKIISFFLIYLALIRSSLARPYATLFRQLEQEKQEHRQHREVLDAVFATTPDLFALKDRQLKFQFANPAFCHFLGKTQEEIVGKSDNDLFPHEEAGFNQQGDREVITSGHQESGDFLITGKSGKRWFHVTKTPVRNAEGTITGLLGSVTDISARKEKETIMAARLNLLRTAESQSLAELLQATLAECESITGSQVGFYHFLDADQTTLSLQTWSTNTLAAMCTAEGSGLHYPVSQAGVWVDCIKKRTPVIHNDYASLPHRQGLPHGHAPIIRELVVPVMRGEVIVAILGVGNKLTNYDDRDVEAVNFLADLAWDITERKRTEAQLRESVQRYEMVLDGATGCIWDWDIPNKKVHFSSRWKTMRGYTDEEISDSESVWSDNIHPDDKQAVMAGVAAHFAGESNVFQMDYRVGCRDGSWKWIQDRGKATRDSTGKVIRMAGSEIDITERKKAEADREKLQAQLQQAQKMEAIGTLAGGIAHDFNNILGAILGYAEMAQEDSPAGSILRQDIDQIVKAGHRARELVKQILAFSRQAETERILLQPAIIVKEAIQMLRSSLPSTIDIKPNIDMDAGLILASPTQIHQIVMNLGTNAFHAMEETGGTLAISLEKKTLNERDIVDKPGVQSGDFVQLSIGDTDRHGPCDHPRHSQELWRMGLFSKPSWQRHCLSDIAAGDGRGGCGRE